MFDPSKFVPRSVLRGTLQLARRLKYGPFEKRLHQASKVQLEWLIRRIRNCESTGFGKDHRFSKILTVDDFRKQVPVADYSYIAPYIDDVAAGNRAALISDQDEFIQFTITTGSTGVPKLNPVTRSWLREYQSGWDVWGIKLFTDHPRYIGSRILQMAGTWDMGRTPCGDQISMVSALLARTQSPLIKPFYAIPVVLNDIRDPVVRHYAALRLSILDEIGWIMLMNPGTLIRLAEIGDQHKELLIRDVSNGTISDYFEIPDSIRTSLKQFIPRPDRKGARQLEEIVNRTGQLLPRDYWKQPVIACWLGGTAGFQSRYLRDYFGDSPMRDMGLVCSEGRLTIPLEDNYAHGVPAIGAGFFEFIPVEEKGSSSPTVLEGHELSADHCYRIVITNSAGYFRFDLGDIVCCRGFVGQAPKLEFVQKDGRIGDLEGEKLTEHQIIEGAHTAAAKLGAKLGLFTGIPRRLNHQKPWYDFLVTISDLPDEAMAKQFLRQLDQELAELNFLWRARRNEGVLAAPRLCRLPKHGWDDYIQKELLRRETGDYQYKHPGLVQDVDWLRNFSPVDTILVE
jgi:hypothetical protein